MEPEPQRSHPSAVKQIKCYCKFLVLITVGVLDIFVVPVYIVVSIATSNTDPTIEESSPWYLNTGKKLPSLSGELNGTRRIKLWPEEEQSDRIKNQLTFKSKATDKIKTILVFNKVSEANSNTGTSPFSECLTQACSLSDQPEDLTTADAVLFTVVGNETVFPEATHRDPHQIWILRMTRSPYHSAPLEYRAGLVNWTASYRADSDIVTPYGFWVYYNETFKGFLRAERNFAAEKTKKVAWFVKDCLLDHNGRLNYVKELRKYIDVDIFGHCTGDYHRCTCSKESCETDRLLNSYKFYLSFEKVNCVDYITEKMFAILEYDVLPVVMGGRPQDYVRVAPEHSYIHVDDFSSPKELAEYLHELDRNDDLYNTYFRWKGTGEVVEARFFCQLCALLHSDFPTKSYEDINIWWRSPGTCTEGSWKSLKKFASRSW